jgi:hypothetical protein
MFSSIADGYLRGRGQNDAGAESQSGAALLEVGKEGCGLPHVAFAQDSCMVEVFVVGGGEAP